jgi:hypothetical protein
LIENGLRGMVAVNRPAGPIVRLPMRDLAHSLAISLKRLGLVRLCCCAAVALLGLGQPAQAANPLELNFWLNGPQYDGRVAPCESALGTITYMFQEKEKTFWNSSLIITGYGNIHEIAFRPWQSDHIPRRYCTGDVMTSDGKLRKVNFSIIEDGGFSAYEQGVEWCVTGLDRNWAYNPLCKAAGP